MLARTTSSRRRRASRSAASPQRTTTLPSRASRPASATQAASSAAPGRVRRASIAVSASDLPQLSQPPSSRSPRGSICGMSEPLAAATDDDDDDDDFPPPSAANRSPRGSFAVPASERSPRGSFAVPAGERSPRGSIAPDPSRSPRGSIIPECTRTSPRGSMVPECTRTSPRGSMVPECTRTSPRGSMVPECTRTSPRGSMVPECTRTSPRGSLVPECTRISPRNSLVPEISRSPRNSLVPDPGRSPRNSLVPDPGQSPRNSLVPDPGRSPRNSLVPGDTSRGSRNSLMLDSGRSPHNSLVPDGYHRSPRNSLVPDVPEGRSPRGSVCSTGAGLVAASFDLAGARSPRGSIIDVTLPGSSRPSRSPSAYRMSACGRGAQINMGYSGTAWAGGESRRASSNISQVSADDRRYLCEQTKLNADTTLGLTAYGSVVYQLKDANMEASGSCDFVCRALRIVYKTVVVTVVLVCLTSLPITMLIIGVQYLRDCPLEPHIPVYMAVGGCMGAVKMLWLTWQQVRSRRYERLDVTGPATSARRDLDDAALLTSAGSRLLSFALSAFLAAWFLLGNYWILHVWWPEFAPTLFEPNRWCDKTLYVFSLVHLCVVYLVVGALLVVSASFFCGQVLACPLLVRYK